MLTIALWAVPVIFAAGSAWKTLKDMKGISGKFGRLEKLQDSRYLVLCIVLMIVIPEKDRPAYAAMLHKAMNP